MEIGEHFILIGVLAFFVAWFINLELVMYLSIGLAFVGQTKRLATIWRVKYSQGNTLSDKKIKELEGEYRLENMKEV